MNDTMAFWEFNCYLHTKNPYFYNWLFLRTFNNYTISKDVNLCLLKKLSSSSLLALVRSSSSATLFICLLAGLSANPPNDGPLASRADWAQLSLDSLLLISYASVDSVSL